MTWRIRPEASCKWAVRRLVRSEPSRRRRARTVSTQLWRQLGENKQKQKWCCCLSLFWPLANIATLTYVDDQNDCQLERFQGQIIDIIVAGACDHWGVIVWRVDVGIVFARASHYFDFSTIELVRVYDESRVEDDDEHQRHEEHEEEQGHVEASHRQRTLGPLDGARRTRRLHWVPRPANQWHQAPHERQRRTTGDHL